MCQFNSLLTNSTQQTTPHTPHHTNVGVAPIDNDDTNDGDDTRMIIFVRYYGDAHKNTQKFIFYYDVSLRCCCTCMFVYMLMFSFDLCLTRV